MIQLSVAVRQPLNGDMAFRKHWAESRACLSAAHDSFGKYISHNSSKISLKSESIMHSR